jgi:hypothetical protein
MPRQPGRSIFSAAQLEGCESQLVSIAHLLFDDAIVRCLVEPAMRAALREVILAGAKKMLRDIQQADIVINNENSYADKVALMAHLLVHDDAQSILIAIHTPQAAEDRPAYLEHSKGTHAPVSNSYSIYHHYGTAAFTS